jgi:hypothetical protein
MKSFALAAVVAAGLLCSAKPADAQFRYRNSYPSYSYSAYTYPTYSYPTYTYPATVVYPAASPNIPSYYSSGIVTAGYTPLGTAASVSTYYNPVWNSYPTYSYPTYGTTYYSTYYGSPYYGGWRR